jgi:hypothetical protein
MLDATDAAIRRLGGWGVNHVRWAFETWDDLSNQTVQEYLDWIEDECDKLEALLPVLAEQGISVNLTIVHPPRGITITNGSSVMNMFSDPVMQTAFVDGWKTIAERFKDDTTVVYYDLLNEPHQGSGRYPGCKNWRELAIEIAGAIRAIDDTKKFIFELPDVNFGGYQPLPGNDWIYSIHVYTPHLLTHQGVNPEYPYPGASYPGTITEDIWDWPEAPDYWDKATLRRYLIEVVGVVDFARDNNVEIYVGEFGCARWAPNHSAYNYINDCLEIFEELGWHWAYFKDVTFQTINYAGNTWSASYSETYNSSTPQSTPTDRLQLLQRYWAKNKR